MYQYHFFIRNFIYVLLHESEFHVTAVIPYINKENTGKYQK